MAFGYRCTSHAYILIFQADRLIETDWAKGSYMGLESNSGS
jgi:hypothetical protein